MKNQMIFLTIAMLFSGLAMASTSQVWGSFGTGGSLRLVDDSWSVVTPADSQHKKEKAEAALAPILAEKEKNQPTANPTFIGGVVEVEAGKEQVAAAQSTSDTGNWYKYNYKTKMVDGYSDATGALVSSVLYNPNTL